jgi:hypothetical protein
MISTLLGVPVRVLKLPSATTGGNRHGRRGSHSRYQTNLQDERDSAYLYRVLADIEPDERLSGVYRRLAETEEKHLQFWVQKIRDAGETVPERRWAGERGCSGGWPGTSAHSLCYRRSLPRSR